MKKFNKEIEELKAVIKELESKEVKSYEEERKLYNYTYALKNLLYQKAGL